MKIQLNLTALWILFITILLTNCKEPGPVNAYTPPSLDGTIDSILLNNLVHTWYPKAIDSVYGGYLSAFDSSFNAVGNQDKMIVSQARHLWNNSKAALHFPNDRPYRAFAHHGFQFLHDKMWDHIHGGFFQLVNRAGAPKPDSNKTAYGNAFGLYAISAYYLMSHDSAALDLAKQSFLWLEQHSHDPKYKGYFQHLTYNGDIIQRDPTIPSTAETGYKDQNSSIHLLEAITELYKAWPDPLVKTRLLEMLYLIRDKEVNNKGNLVLFFTPDWKPVSFRDSSEECIKKHHNLDHVSFGHDIETAYLLMEASEIAGLENDSVTNKKAKYMADQTIRYGWDDKMDGFYDAGYYYKGADTITIINKSKNWWTEAEGLNTLLILSKMYPKDPMNYYNLFLKQWKYIDRYLIDHKYGEWFDFGLDNNPEASSHLKGHIWKAGYHQYRALENCVTNLRKN